MSTNEGDYIPASPQDGQHADGMAEWIKCAYTKTEVDEAGSKLVPWWNNKVPSLEDLGQLAIIVQSWRTSHGFPLNSFQITLRGRAKRIDPKVLIAQRLKRFSSMMKKLVLKEHMRLTQMQDHEEANKAVATLEQSKSGDIDAVLVWVHSFKTLRKAYPNYYADTDAFLAALGQALKK